MPPPPPPSSPWQGLRERLRRVLQSPVEPTRFEEQLVRLFEQSDCGLMGCRADGTIEICSPAAARLLGLSPEALVDSPIGRWLDAGDGADPLQPGLRDVVVRRSDGVHFHAELSVGGRPSAADGLQVLMLRDISDRRQAQERLSFMANFDGLTGLPNRSLFRDRLRQAIERAGRSGRPMALMAGSAMPYLARSDQRSSSMACHPCLSVW